MINPRGDKRCVLDAGQALQDIKQCLKNCTMFNSQHLHLVASIDDAVFILVVLFSPPAVSLERVVVDTARFLFYVYKTVPFNFNDVKFL